MCFKQGVHTTWRSYPKDRLWHFNQKIAGSSARVLQLAVYTAMLAYAVASPKPVRLLLLLCCFGSFRPSKAAQGRRATPWPPGASLALPGALRAARAGLSVHSAHHPTPNSDGTLTLPRLIHRALLLMLSPPATPPATQACPSEPPSTRATPSPRRTHTRRSCLTSPAPLARVPPTSAGSCRAPMARPCAAALHTPLRRRSPSRPGPRAR